MSNLFHQLIQAPTKARAEAIAKQLVDAYTTPADAAEDVSIATVAELLPVDLAFRQPLDNSDRAALFRKALIPILIRKWRTNFLHHAINRAQTLAETQLAKALHTADLSQTANQALAKRELQSAYTSYEQITASTPFGVPHGERRGHRRAGRIALPQTLTKKTVHPDPGCIVFFGGGQP